VRDEIHYEGQAAIELEQRTDPHETGVYPASLHDGVIRGADLVRAAAADLALGTPLGVIAGRFHNGVVDATVRACVEVRARTGLAAVALSGGVFGNVLLTTRTIEGLEGTGFTVLTHSRVPCNDGGISFGQAAVAAATDRSRGSRGTVSGIAGGQTPGDRDQ
jgi:hydrogenase maturation protein HypF